MVVSSYRTRLCCRGNEESPPPLPGGAAEKWNAADAVVVTVKGIAVVDCRVYFPLFS